MKKKAFTLIELLIVITIIVLVTSWGVMYFFKQIASMKLASEIESIVDIIDNLNSEVKSKKILDYSLTIERSKNQRGITYTTNTLGLNYIQKIDFDSISGSWILSTTQNPTWSYVFKIYSWVKFETEQIIDATDTITKSFLNNQEYKISWSLSGSVLNNLYIKYYSADNIIKDNENTLDLIWIYDNSNKSWTNYSRVDIKNLNWKKSIKWNIWWELNKIYLYFEREGIQKFIEIKK